MSHTPGPWTATEDDPAMKMRGANGECVLINDAFWGNENREADARLIAAAPDLLEAAEALIEYVEACDSTSPWEAYKHLAGLEIDLKRAIAKAKGEVE